MGNFIIQKSEERGHANHGWLDSYHSFSFADFFDRNKMNFGVLRVLNDDYIAGGGGFGMHPHENMEIITIPLEGALEHKDSMGNSEVIRQGDIQVMSAGRGIYHSEYNKNSELPVRLLQIWLYPNKQGVEPRYEQLTLNLADRNNRLQQVLSPNPEDEGVWIHQQAWFHLGKFDSGFETSYDIKKPDNGIYVFVIEGKILIENNLLNRRDAIGIINLPRINIAAQTESELLIMELPMERKILY